MSDPSRASLYGSGVFTTIRVVNGEPWLWDKHWRRLMNDAVKIHLDVTDIREELARKELDYAIGIDEMREGRARITLHDARPSTIWPGVETPDGPTTLSIITGEVRDITRPFRLGVSPHVTNSTSPIAGIKTCNYLEQTVSLDECRSRSFNEAIRLNECGHVTSACMANVFWLRGDQLFTPELSTGCLPGTTREFLIEKLDVADVESGIDELRQADAIFLTSAGLGVVQVDEFDGREMPTRTHEITHLVPDGK